MIGREACPPDASQWALRKTHRGVGFGWLGRTLDLPWGPPHTRFRKGTREIRAHSVDE